MNADRGTGRVALSRAPRNPGSSKEDWITNHLKHAYDEALQEAIPAEMLAILDLLDEAQADAPAPEDEGRP